MTDPLISIGDAAQRVVEKLRPAVDILLPNTREEWLNLRRETIGASEVPCLLGVHPWLTAYGLFAVKSGLILADGDETDAMRRGRHVEVLAAEFLREERPAWTIAPNTIPGGKFYRDMVRRVSCTPDIFAVDPDRDGFGVVQVKSVEPSFFRKQWRDDDGNVAPPLYVAVQTIQEAYLTGASWAVAAPVVIGHRIDMPIIDVPLHRPLLDRLHAQVAAFWRGVESGQPPDPDLNRDLR